MKPISDDDLVLLYYGEHNDPELAALVARDSELSTRFAQLCAELDRANEWVPPEQGLDYGARVWQAIAPRLTPRTGMQSRDRRFAWLRFERFGFSLAGVLGIALVAVVAFVAGRNGAESDPSMNGPLEPIAIAVTGLDGARLLNTAVGRHLSQLDLTLTNFVNLSEIDPADAEHATDMLVANRIYRNAAEARGDRQLAAFLAELEPILIELAYEAYKASPATRERMQNQVRDGLLFRVRVLNNRLNTQNSSI